MDIVSLLKTDYNIYLTNFNIRMDTFAWKNPSYRIAALLKNKYSP